MRILALDTATECCSVALVHEGEIVSEANEPGVGHAHIILPMIDALLASASVSLHSLDGIAVGIGPGSFTGVRIGVSVAQALAFAASLPVIAVNSLEALAMIFRNSNAAPIEALACLDARMGEVYWAAYRTDREHGLVEVLAPRLDTPGRVCSDQNSVRRGIGRGFRAYPQLAGIPGVVLEPSDADRLPHAAQIVRLALIRANEEGWLDPSEVQPLYLRDQVARTEAERAVRATS